MWRHAYSSPDLRHTIVQRGLIFPSPALTCPAFLSVFALPSPFKQLIASRAMHCNQQPSVCDCVGAQGLLAGTTADQPAAGSQLASVLPHLQGLLNRWVGLLPSLDASTRCAAAAAFSLLWCAASMAAHRVRVRVSSHLWKCEAAAVLPTATHNPSMPGMTAETRRLPNA
jgi:hypothetical protein